MKIFNCIEGPVGGAIAIVMDLFGYSITHEDIKTADLVIVEGKEQLLEKYTKHQEFAVFSVKKVENLPANAMSLPLEELIPTLLLLLERLKKKIEVSGLTKIEEKVEVEVTTGIMLVPKNTKNARRILVVDDTKENLVLAQKLLGEKHFLTLANGFAEGLELIKKNNYDAVLADSRMPMETRNTPLSIDAIRIGETEPCGMFLAFHATLRGMRAAIVTDANYHQDFVSALFDDLREPMTMNNQPVLFINNMGKQWDKVLKKLLAL